MGTAYNGAYLAPVLRTFVQIPLWGTSDTLGTIGEMSLAIPSQRANMAVTEIWPLYIGLHAK